MSGRRWASCRPTQIGVSWCVPHRRFFSAVPTPSAADSAWWIGRLKAVGQRNHSDWLFSLANQCMRSEVRRQTFKKAHTDGYYFSRADTASTTLNMFSIISRYVKQSVKNESENGTHTLFVVCLYHAVCSSSLCVSRLPVVASFEWRIHTTDACW